MANEMAKANIQRMNGVLNNALMQQKFKNILNENAGAFMASILDLYTSDTNLQKCPADAVVLEALKAATLKLPINKNLGFAYIIPYGTTPTFQIGYKGLIQLAQRTGAYKFINADVVYKGERPVYNRITGALTIEGGAELDKNGRPTDEVIGYFAYIQLLNGFEKAIYWTKAQVEAHAQRYSQAYKSGKADTPWRNNFDAMALKTLLRNLLSKYGVMSIEFAQIMEADQVVSVEPDSVENANKEVLSLDGLGGGKATAAPQPEQKAETVPAPDVPPVEDEDEPF